MKKYFFLILIGILILSCSSSDQREVNTTLIPSANQKSDEMARITFDMDVFQFGKLMEGEKVSHVFRFENTGKSDLVISDVSPECGCTTAKNWSKKPYHPGEKGEITITFESEGRPGITNKRITVMTNAFPAVTDLKLEGEVIGPK